MKIKNDLVTALVLALPLALIGCLKSPQEPTGNTDAKSGLDARHGGVRLALPEIDPAALSKQGKDTVANDTLVQDTSARAWFELSITADNMQPMFFQFPIRKKAGGQTLEITGIPSGKGRRFHGRLFNRNWQLTHEGVAISDIQPGIFTPIRLYLAKATGSADLCVVIEGQRLPPCAMDTLPPPPDPDTTVLGGCWSFSSPLLSGHAQLYDFSVNGMKGVFRTDSGDTLAFTNWWRQADTLQAILLLPHLQIKWLLRGTVRGNDSAWTGLILPYGPGDTADFHARGLPCSLVVDPGEDPVDSLPPIDSLGGGFIPLPGEDSLATL